MVDQRKQAVSIRLGESDIRNIKRIAKRLGARDSDIIRFAIKSTLNRIAPLCDPGIRGRNLVPVLVESGDELIQYFELDAFRLDGIINEDVEAGRQVERDDIALLAMSGLRDEYLVMTGGWQRCPARCRLSAPFLTRVSLRQIRVPVRQRTSGQRTFVGRPKHHPRQ